MPASVPKLGPGFRCVRLAPNPLITPVTGFCAYCFQEFGVGCQDHAAGQMQGLDERRRVGEGHVDFEMTEVLATVSLGYSQRFGM